MTFVRSILLILGAGMLAGCYHYVPAASAPPQGAALRAHLTTMAAFEVGSITVNNVDTVEGEMVRVDAGDVVLSATWLEAATGIGYAGNGWTVRIPSTNVTSLELKRFSWWRTGVILGGVAVGTVLGFNALGFGSAFTGGGGGGGSQK